MNALEVRMVEVSNLPFLLMYREDHCFDQVVNCLSTHSYHLVRKLVCYMILAAVVLFKISDVFSFGTASVCQLKTVLKEASVKLVEILPHIQQLCQWFIK